MIIDHSQKDLDQLEKLITQKNGTPLYGEIDMYRRIVQDCKKSNLTWHFWHDVTLHVPSNGSSEIQIDFLLISEAGVMIIEVKGGPIEIRDGIYYYEVHGNLIPMSKSPFKQAEGYQWALINNKVINRDEIFIDHMCAFPHAGIDNTGIDDLSYKMWNKTLHDSDCSFADFCVSVFDEDKRRKRWTDRSRMSSETLNTIVSRLNPTIKDPGRYNISSLKEILEWLHIANLDALESLQRNNRIVIEGAPGTGKTTIAKAYIKKYNNQQGLYLCWTQLLAAQMRYMLRQAHLDDRCQVETYGSYLTKMTQGAIDLNKVDESVIRQNLADQSYDYVIVDEAQDVADKGLVAVLDELSSTQHTGLQTGRFLVLYDLEQGYNSGTRGLESVIDEITHTAAHFTINGNKRVPNNVEIVDAANRLMDLTSIDALPPFWTQLEHAQDACRICKRGNQTEIYMAVKKKIEELEIRTESTLLVHSDFQEPIPGERAALYSLVSLMDNIQILNEKNIGGPSRRISLTSILRYKGLENNNIILVIPSKPVRSAFRNYLFEIYVGMTRAIMNMDIYIVDVA